MLEKKLNALLANYEVLLRKLQAYHWYVTGPTFFADHAQLEVFYDQAFAAIDEIAEKMLMIGATPYASLRDCLEAATIEEATADPVSSQTIYPTIRDDFQTLLKQVVEAKDAAEQAECHLIDAFADTLIEQLSKNVWMLNQATA